ncbi:MAG: histidine kinase dimerization/phospho-acceptor domain-containing protein [Candidatus Dormibacter sp.]
MSGRLEADEARRRSVLADVAHELRTPITVIRGQAEGIIDGVYAADAEQLRPVLAATRSLEVLVDDLRTLALAEADALQLHKEQIDVGILVENTFSAFRESAAVQHVNLSADIEPPALTVDGDSVRLRSVIANLVGNALRHTHAGGTVRVVGSRAARRAAHGARHGRRHPGRASSPCVRSLRQRRRLAGVGAGAVDSSRYRRSARWRGDGIEPGRCGH